MFAGVNIEQGAELFPVFHRRKLVLAMVPGLAVNQRCQTRLGEVQAGDGPVVDEMMQAALPDIALLVIVIAGGDQMDPAVVSLSQ